MAGVDLLVVESEQLGPALRQDLWTLWDRSFDGTFTAHDAEHAYGGVHVLARSGRRVVGHASAVPRRILVEGQPWRTVGYVEAVATDPEWRGRGVGTQVVRRLQEEIAARWPAALLSTGSATGFYERLGWERWRGTSFTRTATAVVADGEQDGLMVLRVDPSSVPDLGVGVTCEDRSGDAW